MRMVRNELGIGTPLSIQEYKVYEQITEEKAARELNERDRVIAQQLVSRGVARRRVEGKETYYRKL